METTHLRGPGALIAALPVLLGFPPTESVVIVSIRRGGEVGVILRLDRRDCLNPDVASPLAWSVSGHLVKDHAQLVVLVSYTDDDVRLGCPAMDALRPAVADVVDEVDAWAVVRGRYFSPGCVRESCCPLEGRAVPAAPDAPGKALRTAGSTHRGIEASPDVRFEVDEATRRRVARAGARWRERRDDGIVAWRRESFSRWEKALEAVRRDRCPAEAESGALIEALQDRRFRDAIVVSFVSGSAEVAMGVLDGSADGEVSRALATLLSPDEGSPPAPEKVAPAWDLLGFLTANARRRRRAPSLTLCAILAWWEGDGDACRALLHRAHEAEPGYRLAGLLECTVLAGIDPGWRRAA
jgi:hypothetical protein